MFCGPGDENSRTQKYLVFWKAFSPDRCPFRASRGFRRKKEPNILNHPKRRMYRTLRTISEKKHAKYFIPVEHPNNLCLNKGSKV